MDIAIIAALIIAGIIALAIEMFLIPGFSIPGLAGIAMIGYGIFRAKTAYGATGAAAAVLASIAASAVLVAVFLKSRTARKIALEYDIRDAKAGDDYTALIGKQGVALTALRPAGTAIIDDTRYDVVTDGVFIERDTPIEVILVEGVRIVVAPSDGRKD